MGNDMPPLDPSAFPSSTGSSHWLNRKAEISLLGTEQGVEQGCKINGDKLAQWEFLQSQVEKNTYSHLD